MNITKSQDKSFFKSLWESIVSTAYMSISSLSLTFFCLGVLKVDPTSYIVGILSSLIILSIAFISFIQENQG
jgi:hypothetical protein